MFPFHTCLDLVRNKWGGQAK